MANPAHDTEGVARGGPTGSGQPARPSSFVEQVLAELRKVVQPTRQELITYTIVVFVFVVVMIGFIFGLDQVFQRLVALVFAG